MTTRPVSAMIPSRTEPAAVVDPLVRAYALVANGFRGDAVDFSINARKDGLESIKSLTRESASSSVSSD